MAVIIHDFEVVSEPPAPAERSGSPAAASAGQQPAPAASSPHDIERVLRRQFERQLRLRAY